MLPVAILGALVAALLWSRSSSKRAAGACGEEFTLPVRKVVDALWNKLLRCEIVPVGVIRAPNGAVIFEFNTAFSAERAYEVLPRSLEINGRIVPFKVRVLEDAEVGADVEPALVKREIDELLVHLRRYELAPSNVWRDGTHWEAPVIFEFYTAFSAQRARELLPWSLNIAAELVPIRVRVYED